VLILSERHLVFWGKWSILLSKAPFYGFDALFPVPNILLYPYNRGFAMQQEIGCFGGMIVLKTGISRPDSITLFTEPQKY